MKIAVLSDTHDNVWNLDKTLQLIKQETCSIVIHCGDFCAPFTAGILSTIELPIYACFGNNDEDHYALSQKLKAQVLFPLSQEFGDIVLDGKKIAFCHYPKLGKLLASSQEYDAVFHGHTHVYYQDQVGSTLLVNPGAVCGIVSAKPGLASFGVYDTTANNFRLIQI